jgi:hypothetical protein
MDLHPRSWGGKDKFKQSITTLEKEMAALKGELAAIKGTVPVGNTHYVASGQEFGEYSLEELDTYRFKVFKSSGPANILNYSYILTNPTPELSAYLSLQSKTFSTQYIPVDPDAFEAYCMKGNTPFVLTAEIRKCLESKLWDFADAPDNSTAQRNNFVFSTTITIPLTQTYKILPHVSFYVRPFSVKNEAIVEIKELTIKQVTFKINYGHGGNTTSPDLKLHYGISGILATEEQDLI